MWWLSSIKNKQTKFEWLNYLIAAVLSLTTVLSFTKGQLSDTQFVLWHVSILLLQLIMSLSLANTSKCTVYCVSGFLLLVQLGHVTFIFDVNNESSINTLTPYFSFILKIWEKVLHVVIPVLAILSFYRSGLDMEQLAPETVVSEPPKVDETDKES
jgi:hypothetical protein